MTLPFKKANLRILHLFFTCLFGIDLTKRIALLILLAAVLNACTDNKQNTKSDPRVAVLLVDTDRSAQTIDNRIYGQFFEHINHSDVDGLFAEQIQGCGFEGEDFKTHWKVVEEKGKVSIEETPFKNGEKSVRLTPGGGKAGIEQGRVYLQKDIMYDGSAWLKVVEGSPEMVLQVNDSKGQLVATVPLPVSGAEWQEVPFSFSVPETETHATIQIVASGNGVVLLDFVSLMQAEVRKNGMLRPDLLEALRALKPSFIRWPGGSFASTYKWKDGIGPHVSRKYHPNEMWGGYSDYYGFGTHEFLEMCRQLDAEPMIVLPAMGTEPEQVQYAMDWVHYLIDPPTTEWGKLRAANGHPDPYVIPYFQIDNEPMNNNFTPDQYAEIVNVYGSELRKIAPQSRIVACGQKRSNDMVWSQKVIDLAGKNFDILGCHNYEYENENYETGLLRIQDYLVKLRDYVRTSSHPSIKIAVLEWSLCRTYDWRAGLHTAGSLIMYEKLSPEVEMTCPALLMRNTTDDPEWRAFIYHDHVSWFPGSGYIVEKLFREHYAEKHFASAGGTFSDIEKRTEFFDDISQMKPEDWQAGGIDAIATGSDDGKRIVIKAVNYQGNDNILLVRLQGSRVGDNGTIKTYTVSAGLNDEASLKDPDKIKPTEGSMPYSRDLTITLPPYTVSVLEIQTE